MHSTEVLDCDKRLVAAVDYYFIQEDGSRFKVTLPFKPYMYLRIKKVRCVFVLIVRRFHYPVKLQESMQETQAYLSKRHSGLISSMAVVEKEDLDMANHLTGIRRAYLKLDFLTTTDMQKAIYELCSLE